MFAMIIGWKLIGGYVLDAVLAGVGGYLVGRKQFSGKTDEAKK